MTVQDRTTTSATTSRSSAGGVDTVRWWFSGRNLKAWASAALAGALAGVVAWLLIAVPVLITWFADPLSTVSAWQALGISATGWALAHRGVVDAPEASVHIMPLLLTAVPVLLCRYAARHVLTEDDSSARTTLIGGFSAAWHGIRANELVAFVLGYLVAGLLICFGADMGAAPVSFWRATPGLLLVALTGIGLALIREHRRAENPTIARALRWLTNQIPVLARRGLKPAGEALGSLVVMALVVVVTLVALRVERVGALYAALDAGPIGVLILTVGQLLFLPNLVLWALGWMAGAGLSIGTVTVGWGATTSGDLPLIPVLAALPEPGPIPEGMWAVGALPVLAGAWLGFRSARSAPRLASWWVKARVALAACAWVGGAVLSLSWLAAGSVTPGLLGVIGTAPFAVTGALLAELLVGAGTVVTGMHLSHRRL